MKPIETDDSVKETMELKGNYETATPSRAKVKFWNCSACGERLALHRLPQLAAHLSKHLEVTEE